MGRRFDEADHAPNGLVVSISRRFPCPSFDLVGILKMPCNGGNEFSFYVCQKQEMMSTKSRLSGKAVTLAAESQITGKAALGAIIDRNRLGASRAVQSLLSHFLERRYKHNRRD